MASEEIERLLDDGVVVINKPPGHTSHEITGFVKKITGAKRSGHAGTLDPDVSGVLPVAIGKATKLLRYIAGKEKTYVGIVRFKKEQTQSEIETLFKKFTGELVQTPPKMSAVRKAPRKRTVYELKLLEVNGHNALFITRVDAGTYIRTLCEDIGKICGGARMEELRRIAVGRISEKQSHTMEELIDAMWFYKEKKDPSLLLRMIKPPERFIDLKKAFIKESALDSIFSGAQVMAPALESLETGVQKNDRVAMFCGDRFIGVGIAQLSAEEAKKSGHGLAIKLERVHKG